MGKKWNFEFVMGKNRLLWCCPCWSSLAGLESDGTVFVKRGRGGRIIDLEERESESVSKSSEFN